MNFKIKSLIVILVGSIVMMQTASAQLPSSEPVVMTEAMHNDAAHMGMTVDQYLAFRRMGLEESKQQGISYQKWRENFNRKNHLKPARSQAIVHKTESSQEQLIVKLKAQVRALKLKLNSCQANNVGDRASSAQRNESIRRIQDIVPKTETGESSGSADFAQ